MSYEMPKFEEKKANEGQKIFVPKEQPKPIEVPDEEGKKFERAGFSEQDMSDVRRLIGQEFSKEYPGTGKIDGSPAFTSIKEVHKVSETEATIVVKKGTMAFPDSGSDWEVKVKKVDGTWKLEKAVEL